jgi:aminoglycoside phosphotransferase family enzyme
MVYALSHDGGKKLASQQAKEIADVGPSSSGQGPLIIAMLDPSFYPRRPSEVAHRETHISHLFFAGDLVYKIKKAVRFSFLDFSTLSKRRYFLHEELRLNQRLAPSVYLGVLPISQEDHGWKLGSYADPVEYTLVMRRLPERRMLPFLLERNLVTPQMMRSLAEVLAPFHAQAPTNEKINQSGHPQFIQKLWDENLADIEPFVGRLLDPETLEAFQDFGRRFITKHCDLLMRRVHEGHIREVHGDLHCEHICFAPEGIQIFDCIEFNPQLRYGDIASEIAFLLMDLEFRGAATLAEEFTKRYRELADDHELPLLLPFYKCYRALVRGKIEGLR